MARYEILISKRACRFLNERVDRETKGKILDEVADLENFPFLSRPHDMAKLKGKKNYYRFRVGQLRIIFRIDKPSKKIYVEKIDYRKSVYK